MISDNWKVIVRNVNDDKTCIKTTKHMRYMKGYLVNTSTMKKNYDNTYSVSESTIYVPREEIDELDR